MSGITPEQRKELMVYLRDVLFASRLGEDVEEQKAEVVEYVSSLLAEARQDAERWRYCSAANRFPVDQHLFGPHRWAVWAYGERFQGATPEEALHAARGGPDGGRAK